MGMKSRVGLGVLATAAAVAAALVVTMSAGAVACNPSTDPGCDPGGGETTTTIQTDLDVANPAQGRVDELGDANQISCGSTVPPAELDCHGDYSFVRTCADFDCTTEGLDTVTLVGTGGPFGYSPQFSYCEANSAGTACVSGMTTCGLGNCAITMDKSYRASLSWIDTSPPTTSFAFPRSVVGPTANTFTALAGDNTGVTRVEFHLDGAPLGNDTTPGDGFRSSVNTSSLVHDSEHTITARAFDAAGNAGSIATHTFTVDRQTAVSITSPGGGGHFENAPPFGFTKDGDATASCSTVTDGGTAIHTAACSSSYTPQPAGDGTYKMRVQSTDAVGNTATAERTFVIDDTDPSVSIASPPPGSRVPSPFTPAFTASDGGTPADELIVECQLDGGAFGSCGPIIANDGAHTLTVRARDKAGNTRSQSVAFSTGSSDGASNAGGGSSTPGDTSPPTWTFKAAARQRVLRARALAFTVTPNEPCTLTVTAKLGKTKLGSLKKSLAGGTGAKLKVKVSLKGLAVLRAKLKRSATTRVSLALRCVDAVNLSASSTKAVKVRR